MFSRDKQNKISLEIPPEIKKFNWGAFSLTWIWGLVFRVWISLFTLIVFVSFVAAIIVVPMFAGIDNLFFNMNLGEILGLLTLIITLVFALYLGFKGNSLVWKTGRYNDIEKFNHEQKGWSNAGKLIFVFFVVFVVPAIFLVGFVSRTHMSSGGSALGEDLTYFQTELEQINADNGVYCGEGENLNNFPCGDYSLERLKQKLNAKHVRLIYQCTNPDIKGGGKAEIYPDKYTITSYDGFCKEPLPEYTLTEKSISSDTKWHAIAANEENIQGKLIDQCKQYKECCGVNDGEITCGTYSFQQMGELLNIHLYSFNVCTDTEILGGGKVLLEKDKGTVQGYEANCLAPIDYPLIATPETKVYYY